MNVERPDPEVLLQRIKQEEREQKRGKLKIFFGAAPGVGKTFAMLKAARLLAEQGADIVIGYVETHKRAETAELILGLEILPRRKVEYRGTTLEEFDLETALARRPQIIVVDELAHTNAPGSRYAKRHEDVEVLLEAGIHVFTTLNVQHLESMNDVIEQITLVKIRETIPDTIFEQADEVELIDLPSDVLLQRLQEGKVYVPDTAKEAIANFFRKGNLTALRELALRRTAEWVDSQMRLYQREHGIDRVWPAGERILVAIGPSEFSQKVLRAAKRLAVGLHAEMIALHVETPASARLSQAKRDRIVQCLRLAERLEAEAIMVSGISVAEEIVRYARSRNVSKIVLGKPARSLWREVPFFSLVPEVIHRAKDMDIYVIRGEESEVAEQSSTTTGPSLPFDTKRYGYAAGIVGVLTGLGWLMHGTFDLANIVMIYLVGILIAAIFLGRGPSVLASILSVAAFDFFFVPPQLTFAVSDTQYLITFAVMLVVALVISRFTTRISDQAEEAREKERRTAALFAMTREFAVARIMEEILDAASRHLRNTFASQVAILLPDKKGKIQISPDDKAAFSLDATESSAAQWSLHHGVPAGKGTSTLPSSKAYFIPLKASRGKIGVIGLKPTDETQIFTPIQLHLLETFVSQIALAMERGLLIQEMQKVQVEAETERVRSALLSSVSHDLRTPLAAIQGAASTLAQGQINASLRSELADSIVEESGRLNRLIENLVFATRLEGGKVEIHKDLLVVEEFVGSALRRLHDVLRDRQVATSFPADLPLVRGDGLLLEQVVLNFLENALRYSPAKSALYISACVQDNSVIVCVKDEGPGLPEGEENKIFERFYRGKISRSEGGMGLGLYICKGIIEAHGGKIWAENVSPQGAAFLFALLAEPKTELV